MNSNPFETNNDLKFISKNLYQRPAWFLKFTQENYYGKYAWHFLYLAALGSQLGKIASMKSNIVSWSGLFFQILILGSGLTLLFYIICAYIFSATSKLFKGEATAGDILRVMSYSSIPAIVPLVFYVIGAILYGLPFFSSSFWLADADLAQRTFKYCVKIINTLAGINIMIFLVLGVAVVNNFSILKSILTILSPMLILMSIILLMFTFS
ncbi:MAG: YIP1 family protein [Sphingobacterium sp.]